MLGSYLYGLNITFPGIALDGIQGEFKTLEIDEFKRKAFTVGPSLTSAIGSFICLLLLQKIRHKIILSASSFLLSILWFLLIITNEKHFWVAIILENLQGLIIGGFLVIIPVYMVELSPPKLRNLHGFLHQTGQSIGNITCSVINAFASWKTFTCIGGVVCLIFGGMALFLPDNMQSRLIKDRTRSALLNNNFLKDDGGKKFSIVIILMIFQQLSGINAIMSNLKEMLDSTGITFHQYLQNAIASASGFSSTIVSAFICDYIGKRKLWTFSCIGTSICLLLYAINIRDHFADWVVTLCVFMYLLFFGFGLGAIPWYISAMLFSPVFCWIPQAVAAIANMVFSFIIVFLYPITKDGIGEFNVVIIYTLLTICSAVYGAVFIPDEVDNDFQGVTVL